MQRGFLLPPGAPGGSLALYQGAPDGHREFAEQIAAEELVDVLQGGRLENVYVWHLKPGCRNDYADACVYAAVAASFCRIRFGSGLAPTPTKTARKGNLRPAPVPGLPNAADMPKIDTPMTPRAVNPLLDAVRQRRHRPHRNFINAWR